MAIAVPTGREVAISLAEWLEATARRIRMNADIEANSASFNIKNEVEELPHDHPEVLAANAVIHQHVGRTQYTIEFELVDPETLNRATARRERRS